MTTSANNTESNKDSTDQTPQADSGYTDEKPTEENKTEEKESNIDDFGYEKTPEVKEESKEEPTEEKEPETKEEDEKPVEKPATGYGEDEEPEEKKPESKDEEPSKKEEIEKSLGELPEGYNKDTLSKFALENNMTKDQIEAYVKLTKEESQQVKLDNEARVKATRKQWKEELKNDPTFGGELFDKNVDRVEKILDNHLPNMKKTLTDRGTMLPPYIMKDLLALSKVLNPTTKLVKGESSKVEKKETNFLDDMYE